MALESLKQRATLFSAGKNTIWLLLDVFVKKLVGLLVGVQVARYLGDENWGIYNYGFVFISFFSVIGSLGIDQLLIRDFAKKEVPEEKIIGTAFSLKFAAASITSAMALLIAYLQSGWSIQTMAVGILSIAYVFNSFIIFDDWFQSRVQSKYPVIARNIAAIVIALAKLVAIYQMQNVLVFVALGGLELALGWGLLWPFYLRIRERKVAWQIDTKYIFDNLKSGIPLLTNSFIAMLGARVDQLLLGLLILSKAALGQYATAVMIAEIAIVLSSALSNSAFPSVVQAKKESEELYKYRMQLVTTTVFWLGFIVTIGLSLFAPWLIAVVFGEKYQLAGEILRIYAWSNIPIFWGSIWNNFVIIEDKQNKILWVSIVNAVTNTLGNLLVIPMFGAVGAAWVNLGSLTVSMIFSMLLYKPDFIGSLLLGAIKGQGIFTRYGERLALIGEFLQKRKI